MTAKEWLMEKPKNATAVTATLKVVTRSVPSLRVNRSLCRLETMVPVAMIMEMMPAWEMGTSKAGYMTGQAEPSKASGRPRLIKER